MTVKGQNHDETRTVHLCTQHSKKCLMRGGMGVVVSREEYRRLYPGWDGWGHPVAHVVLDEQA